MIVVVLQNMVGSIWTMNIEFYNISNFTSAIVVISVWTNCYILLFLKIHYIIIWIKLCLLMTETFLDQRGASVTQIVRRVGPWTNWTLGSKKPSEKEDSNINSLVEPGNEHNPTSVLTVVCSSFDQERQRGPRKFQNNYNKYCPTDNEMEWMMMSEEI